MAVTATNFALQKGDVVAYDRSVGTIDIIRDGESLRCEDVPAKHYIGLVDHSKVEKFVAFMAKLFGLKAGRAEWGSSTTMYRLDE